ncbi:major pollen allergen Ole e 10 isoform X2 [Brachypodium distachyon]|uniref:major pollen allergen Ole e 10 isoform X2 n=1 Tax=Brachypodium distachyon TaxID=15368 RepID=UPI0001C73987|nr:major pollen allergen Ole e 10 isoform X2 [Brachypodium distachyon]|eukprot:XP_010234283.1 major pollen allergen Ole e 10 isoform X2 [Brachypodium distachyon]
MASSTTVRFIFCALMLLMHRTTYAAARRAPNFQQNQDGKTWCVAKPSTGEDALRANLEFACSESDCSAIQGTGGCSPLYGGVLLSRASVAMNAYYQAKGRNSWNCFFNGTGLIAITDPSLGTCKYA